LSLGPQHFIEPSTALEYNTREITAVIIKYMIILRIGRYQLPYNIDQDYYGLAEVASTFYYDYQHKKVAALQTVTNETAEPVTRQIKQILDYNMVRIFKTTYFLNDKSKHIDIGFNYI
jgi:hypothetical protein